MFDSIIAEAISSNEVGKKHAGIPQLFVHNMIDDLQAFLDWDFEPTKHFKSAKDEKSSKTVPSATTSCCRIRKFLHSQSTRRKHTAPNCPSQKKMMIGFLNSPALWYQHMTVMMFWTIFSLFQSGTLMPVLLER